jgi:hypothetical protein
VRKFVAATVSVTLCMLSVTPAIGQDYRYAGFDAPRGATATANLRVPLGRQAKAKPTYGLTFGYGRRMGAGLDGREATRQLRFADLRFSSDGRIKQANVASFDLANLDRDRRLNLTGGMSTTWIVVGLIAAGIAVCVATECYDGNDDDAAN